MYRTVRGTGTVVTGTVWSGELRRDASVRLLPSGRRTRVRALQSHGRAVDALGPATRGAVALVGVEVAEVERGTMLVSDEAWEPSRVLRADIRFVGDASAPPGARTRFTLHLGTSEVQARVLVAAGPVREDGSRGARIALEAPVVARAGDRFVLRTLSPVTTIGGGVVVDPSPLHRRARAWSGGTGSVEERLAALLREAGARGVEGSRLPIRLGLRPDEVRRLLDGAARRVVRCGELVVGRDALESLRTQLLTTLDELHRSSPLDPSVPLQPLRARLAAPRPVVDEAVSVAVESGAIVIDGGNVRLSTWAPTLSAEQSLVLDALERRLSEAGREPPSMEELAGELGPAVLALVAVSERAGHVRQVEPGRYYHRQVLHELVNHLSTTLEPGREYAPTELREVLGVSRKYLIPLLEFFDRERLTERTPTGRRWCGTFSPGSGFK
jgi:selenocysteine-specific elongation factor